MTCEGDKGEEDNEFCNSQRIKGELKHTIINEMHMRRLMTELALTTYRCTRLNTKDFKLQAEQIQTGNRSKS
jgi:hypothetical protein